MDYILKFSNAPELYNLFANHICIESIRKSSGVMAKFHNSTPSFGYFFFVFVKNTFLEFDITRTPRPPSIWPSGRPADGRTRPRRPRYNFVFQTTFINSTHFGTKG